MIWLKRPGRGLLIIICFQMHRQVDDKMIIASAVFLLSTLMPVFDDMCIAAIRAGGSSGFDLSIMTGFCLFRKTADQKPAQGIGQLNNFVNERVGKPALFIAYELTRVRR